VRRYCPRVALESSTGWHIRYVPAELARALVDAGQAEIAHQNGRIRSIRLVVTAATHARMIGPPGEGRASGLRFYRWVRLEESATCIVEHHPRSWDYE
jgi:hypothetical protein